MIKINSLEFVITHYKSIIESKKVLLILDVDDTTLSSKIGQKFVDIKIKELVDISFDNNLLFLTARAKSLGRYTQNQLNRSHIISRGKYNNYKIICSPRDDEGNSTKGNSALLYLKCNEFDYVIFVDDDPLECEDVKEKLTSINIEHTVYLFNP